MARLHGEDRGPSGILAGGAGQKEGGPCRRNTIAFGTRPQRSPRLVRTPESACGGGGRRQRRLLTRPTKETLVKTSIAEANANRCPLCGDEVTEDRRARG